MHIVTICITENMTLCVHEAVTHKPVHMQYPNVRLDDMAYDTAMASSAKINSSKTNCNGKMLPNKNDEFHLIKNATCMQLICHGLVLTSQTLWKMTQAASIRKLNTKCSKHVFSRTRSHTN